MPLDPVTLAVIQNGLRQVASEMDLVHEKTSFSPVISEGFDRSNGIYDRTTGEVVAQGELGLPIFVGVMQFTTQAVIERRHDLEPGDVILVNDPYLGGTHLMDVKMVRPFYYRGRLWCYLSKRPKFSWSFEPDGSIQVKAETNAIAAALWQAANPVARDFRLEAIGPAYRRSALEERGDGVYIAKSPKPAQGWVAYFIELTFPSGGLYPFKFTTGVRVAPLRTPAGNGERANIARRGSRDVEPWLKSSFV